MLEWVREALADAIAKVQDTVLVCPTVIAQVAAVAAMDEGPAYTRGFMPALAEVRDIVLSALRSLEPLCTVPPADGAFYCFLRVNVDADPMSVAERLVAAGCAVLMPWAAPIGSARGLMNPYALKSLRAYFPATPLIIDDGIGAPSHAAAAMELGYDGVLLNTAVAKAADPVRMAQAFARAIEAGRAAFEAGLIEARDMASPSTPVAGTPFFDLGRAKRDD